MTNENKTPQESTNKQETVRIPVEKYLWPDLKAQQEDKKSRRNMTIAVSLSLLVVFVMGWLLGSAAPFGSTTSTPTTRTPSTNARNAAIQKMTEVYDLMEGRWYFGQADETNTQGIVDNALYGMTKTTVDPHTTYMSEEELSGFYTSINMNFVGIGVQFLGGENMIERVFKDSPAEKAGVLPGDIIHIVDGTVVDGFTSTEVGNLVKGEEGTDVVIEFIREGQPLTLTITRANVASTAYGYLIEDGIGYLQISGFGDSTADEVKGYLDDLQEQGATSLIIDLRDDGGGYLDACAGIANYFLERQAIIMQQEYADGTIEYTRSKGSVYENFNQLVILINENTASASEVLTLALKENRDDVTLMGTTSYGKGTVQVTQSLTDGSAVKYTTSRWLSPNGEWVNGVGITPDKEVRLHDVLYMAVLDYPEDTTFELDSVSEYTKTVQASLDFLGYSVNRMDGYFDESTAAAIRQYQTQYGLPVTGTINQTDYEAILGSVTKAWGTDPQMDTQLQAALEALRG